MTQAHTPPSSSGSLAQAWDDLIRWLSNAPPSVQAQAQQNPQAALNQFGLGNVSGPQLQSAIQNSGSFNHGHTVNQGFSGNSNSGNHLGGGAPHPCPPGAPPADVFTYYVSNNYSQIVDNSVNVGGDFTGDIDQHNVVGSGNTFGDEFDIDGDMSGQIVTGDHSNAAGGDLDASVMGAGAVRMGDGNSFGNGANFGSGDSTYTDNRGGHIDNSVDNSDHSVDNSDHSYSDSSDHSYSDSSDHSYSDSSDHSYSDSSDHSDHSDHSVDASDHSTSDSHDIDSGGGNVDIH